MLEVSGTIYRIKTVSNEKSYNHDRVHFPALLDKKYQKCFLLILTRIVACSPLGRFELAEQCGCSQKIQVRVKAHFVCRKAVSELKRPSDNLVCFSREL